MPNVVQGENPDPVIRFFVWQTWGIWGTMFLWSYRKEVCDAVCVLLVALQISKWMSWNGTGTIAKNAATCIKVRERNPFVRNAGPGMWNESRDHLAGAGLVCFTF